MLEDTPFLDFVDIESPSVGLGAGARSLRRNSRWFDVDPPRPKVSILVNDG